jgi:hypothetical protein
MGEASWDYLTPRWPSLARQGNLAEAQLSRGEYDSCLATTRKFAEIAIDAIFRLKNLPRPPGKPKFVELIAALSARSAMPRAIVNAFHFLRSRGNQSSHEDRQDDPDIAVECELAIRYAIQIAAFMHRESGGDPALAASHRLRRPAAPDQAPVELPPAPALPTPVPPASGPPSPAQSARKPERPAGAAAVHKVLHAYLVGLGTTPAEADRRIVAPGTALSALADHPDGAAVRVVLEPGVHALGRVLRPMIIEAEDGAVIEAAAEGAVVALDGDVSIAGVRLAGGPLTLVAGTLRLSECTCAAPVNAATSRALLEADRCVFERAPVHVGRAAQAVITSSQFREGDAAQVLASGSARVSLADSSFTAARRAALFAADSEIVAEICTLANNAVAAEAGPGGRIVMTGCTLQGNTRDVSEAEAGSIQRN